MKRSLVLLALAAGCATPGAATKPEGPADDLVAVARAMTAIEAADLRGEIAEERDRRAGDASARPKDLAAQYLALYARPRNEATWDLFRALSESAPLSAWGHLGMARIYQEWGTHDQADVEFNKALKIDPDNWIVRRVRGESYEKRQRLDEARTEFDAVVAKDPDNPEARVGLARLALRKGDAAKAREEAQRALKAEPKFHAALTLLGGIALKDGDKKAAAELLHEAAAASPRDREARVALAKLNVELGDSKGAMEEWKEAIALRDDEEGERALAELARAANDAEVEGKAIERLAKLDPGRAEVWKRLAELRLAAKDDAGAESALRNALQRAPADEESHLMLARLHKAKGRLADALGELRLSGEPAKAEREEIEKALFIEPLAAKDLNAVQREVGKRIDKTYQERLKLTPKLAGGLKVRADVDKEGVAKTVEVLDDTLKDDFVRASAYWNLKDASYPKGKAGRFTFSFELKPAK